MYTLKALLFIVFMATGFFIFARTIHPTRILTTTLNDSTSQALKKISNREARKAALFSTFLPGAGQVYNRKYWKVPLIYGAFAGLGYFYQINNKEYVIYKTALLARYDDDPTTVDLLQTYSSENLVLLKKQYKKRRDFCMIGIVATYVLNIIDANVDGHLRGFNKSMDEKIAFTIKPCSDVLYTFTKPVYYSGLQFNLHF